MQAARKSTKGKEVQKTSKDVKQNVEQIKKQQKSEAPQIAKTINTQSLPTTTTQQQPPAEPANDSIKKDMVAKDTRKSRLAIKF